ncbi:MAG TPA: hypothetical protein VGD67_01395 [Pseudonocardiaceae bacterium]
MTSVVLVVTVLTGCAAGFGEDSGRCSVSVDQPHESSGTPGSIVGKARIRCDVAAADVQLHVVLEEEGDGGWIEIGTPSDPVVGAVQPGAPHTRQATTGCRGGTFRTGAHGSGRLGGVLSQSRNRIYSRPVSNPCVVR